MEINKFFKFNLKQNKFAISFKSFHKMLPFLLLATQEVSANRHSVVLPSYIFYRYAEGMHILIQVIVVYVVFITAYDASMLEVYFSIATGLAIYI